MLGLYPARNRDPTAAFQRDFEHILNLDPHIPESQEEEQHRQLLKLRAGEQQNDASVQQPPQLPIQQQEESATSREPQHSVKAEDGEKACKEESPQQAESQLHQQEQQCVLAGAAQQPAGIPSGDTDPEPAAKPQDEAPAAATDPGDLPPAQLSTQAVVAAATTEDACAGLSAAAGPCQEPMPADAQALCGTAQVVPAAKVPDVEAGAEESLPGIDVKQEMVVVADIQAGSQVQPVPPTKTIATVEQLGKQGRDGQGNAGQEHISSPPSFAVPIAPVPACKAVQHKSLGIHQLQFSVLPRHAEVRRMAQRGCSNAQRQLRLFDQAVHALRKSFSNLKDEVKWAAAGTCDVEERYKPCRCATLSHYNVEVSANELLVSVAVFAVHKLKDDFALMVLFIATPHDYQRRGLGALLVARLKQLAYHQGCKAVFSNVVRAQAPQRFWSYCSFVDTKEMDTPDGMSPHTFSKLQQQCSQDWKLGTLVWGCTDLDVDMRPQSAKTRLKWLNIPIPAAGPASGPTSQQLSQAGLLSPTRSSGHASQQPSVDKLAAEVCGSPQPSCTVSPAARCRSPPLTGRKRGGPTKRRVRSATPAAHASPAKARRAATDVQQEQDMTGDVSISHNHSPCHAAEQEQVVDECQTSQYARPRVRSATQLASTNQVDAVGPSKKEAAGRRQGPASSGTQGQPAALTARSSATSTMTSGSQVPVTDTGTVSDSVMGADDSAADEPRRSGRSRKQRKLGPEFVTYMRGMGYEQPNSWTNRSSTPGTTGAAQVGAAGAASQRSQWNAAGTGPYLHPAAFPVHSQSSHGALTTSGPTAAGAGTGPAVEHGSVADLLPAPSAHASLIPSLREMIATVGLHAPPHAKLPLGTSSKSQAHSRQQRQTQESIQVADSYAAQPARAQAQEGAPSHCIVDSWHQQQHRMHAPMVRRVPPELQAQVQRLSAAVVPRTDGHTTWQAHSSQPQPAAELNAHPQIQLPAQTAANRAQSNRNIAAADLQQHAADDAYEGITRGGAQRLQTAEIQTRVDAAPGPSAQVATAQLMQMLAPLCKSERVQAWRVSAAAGGSATGAAVQQVQEDKQGSIPSSSWLTGRKRPPNVQTGQKRLVACDVALSPLLVIEPAAKRPRTNAASDPNPTTHVTADVDGSQNPDASAIQQAGAAAGTSAAGVLSAPVAQEGSAAAAELQTGSPTMRRPRSSPGSKPRPPSAGGGLDWKALSLLPTTSFTPQKVLKDVHRRTLGCPGAPDTLVHACSSSGVSWLDSNDAQDFMLAEAEDVRVPAEGILHDSAIDAAAAVLAEKGSGETSLHAQEGQPSQQPQQKAAASQQQQVKAGSADVQLLQPIASAAAALQGPAVQPLVAADGVVHIQALGHDALLSTSDALLSQQCKAATKQEQLLSRRPGQQLTSTSQAALVTADMQPLGAVGASLSQASVREPAHTAWQQQRTLQQLLPAGGEQPQEVAAVAPFQQPVQPAPVAAGPGAHQGCGSRQTQPPSNQMGQQQLVSQPKQQRQQQPAPQQVDKLQIKQQVQQKVIAAKQHGHVRASTAVGTARASRPAAPGPGPSHCRGLERPTGKAVTGAAACRAQEDEDEEEEDLPSTMEGLRLALIAARRQTVASNEEKQQLLSSNLAMALEVGNLRVKLQNAEEQLQVQRKKASTLEAGMVNHSKQTTELVEQVIRGVHSKEHDWEEDMKKLRAQHALEVEKLNAEIHKLNKDMQQLRSQQSYQVQEEVRWHMQKVRTAHQEELSAAVLAQRKQARLETRQYESKHTELLQEMQHMRRQLAAREQLLNEQNARLRAVGGSLDLAGDVAAIMANIPLRHVPR